MTLEKQSCSLEMENWNFFSGHGLKGLVFRLKVGATVTLEKKKMQNPNLKEAACPLVSGKLVSWLF